MITQENVSEKILAYLNSEIDESTLIHWAENAMITLSEADEEVSDESLLMDILGYIGVGDTEGFPLTWDLLRGFLEQLGTKVRVVTQ